MRYSGTIIPVALHEQSCYVDTARNMIVEKFLQTDAHYLLMVDVDIAFDAHAPLATYEILRSQNADVCYGNYVLGNGGNSIFGPPNNAAQEAAVLVNLQPNAIYTDISTGGTGWVMMTRPLLERVRKAYPGPWPWFGRDLTTDGKSFRGEDVTFGLRLWRMDPRPKVIGTTSLMLRHLKQLPFIPDHMTGQAAMRGVSAFSAPNPYEDKSKFIINGHQVIDRATLTPEQIAEVEAQIFAKQKEAGSAVGRSNEQVQEGQAPQLQQEGPEGKKP